MPRKRMIDPSFWRDEKLGQCSFMERLLFIGLWTFSEDHGVGRASPLLIKADVFPYEALREADIDRSLAKLASLGLIQLYEADGQRYYHITNFKKYQSINRPSPSTLPLPLTEHSLNTHGALTPNIREVNINNIPDLPSGGEGEKEQKGNEAVDIDEAFEKSYRHYPRKVGKAKGKQLYIAYLKGRSVKGQGKVRLTHHQMTLAIKAYAAEVGEREPDKIKHFDSFMGSAIIDYAERTADDYEAAMKELYGEEWRCISFEYG